MVLLRKRTQLYFSVAPDQSGTATLTVQQTNLSGVVVSEQTMVVQVNPMNDVPPVIAQASPSLTNLIVHGGRLYANSVTPTTQSVSPFLTTARALGGHLININTIEEINFVRTTATSGLVSQEAWFGMVLPQRIFPGELSWVTNDSTIAYGYSSANGTVNHTVYPGHFVLDFFTAGGLEANRTGSGSTVFNWTIYSLNADVYFLLDDGGNGTSRHALYEFPQGLPIATNSAPIRVVLSATVQFTGFDLNGDTINTNDWSITDPNGGSAIFNPTAGNTGVQTVNMVYTPPANFGGQTTVVVTLTVGGLSTTAAITFMVPPPPTIALSANVISLDEDFGTFDIATTATEQGVSTSLPFSVQASASGIVTITTSANNIQLSAVPHANGLVTLTIRTTDSASFRGSTQVVVTVRSVNDTPDLNRLKQQHLYCGWFFTHHH